ncbi:MAG: sigma-E processing peptidase SpoIIGA, partial [Clostridia bacterium]
PDALQIAIKVLLAPIITLIFDKYKNIKDYIVSLILFAVLTFGLGGIITGISNLLGIDLNNYVALGLTALSAVFGLIFVYVLVRHRAKSKIKTCDIKIKINGNEYLARGMRDTGNTLTDSVSGLPVVIVSKALEIKLTALDCVKTQNFDGYIEVNTISGKSSMPILKFENITVDNKNFIA